MYTPGPPVRDKYWLPLGLNWNGKLRERAFANACSGAPDILWPQVGMGPHSLLSNHGQATIIARLGCTRACSAAVAAKAVSTFAGVKFYIFTAVQIRCPKYIYLPRIMPRPNLCAGSEIWNLPWRGLYRRPLALGTKWVISESI